MEIGKIFTSLLLCLGMAINSHAAENVPPDTTIDGLHRVDGTVMAVVYAKPDVDLSQLRSGLAQGGSGISDLILWRSQIRHTAAWSRISPGTCLDIFPG